MGTNENKFHGSDVEYIEEKYHIQKEELINYSSNCNPLGISPKIKKELADNIELIASYPDRNYTALIDQIRKYCKTSEQNIIVGNGSTELISLAIKCINPKKALVLGPTYSEYEKEIFLNGGSTYYYRLKEELDFQLQITDIKSHLTDNIDLLILCNPNNPTSTAVEKNTLRQILDHCKEKDIFVLIDETYVEFTENINNITAIPFTNYYSNLMILRGVSKFFSAPGLRLGYGICGNETIRDKINKNKNPWTINALAALAGEIMLSDTEYIEKTRTLIDSERTRLYNELLTWDNIKVYKPEANFILIKLLDKEVTSTQIFEKLIKEKILIRDVSDFPFLNSQYIRFCLQTPENNTKLLKTLKSCIS